MADGGEIGAAFDRIGEYGFVKSALRVGIGIAVDRRLVNGSMISLRTGLTERK
jgi:hypothetical protein